jgi:hypothetical protein
LQLLAGHATAASWSRFDSWFAAALDAARDIANRTHRTRYSSRILRDRHHEVKWAFDLTYSFLRNFLAAGFVPGIAR